MRNQVLSFIFVFLSFSIYSQKSISGPESSDYSTVNDTVKNKKGEILEEVIVTSNQQRNPVSVGKAGIAPMDLPQTTAIITNATLERQQAVSMTDVLKNSNGVYIMGTTGGYQEEIASRGSAMNGSNTFKNGVRYFSGMATELQGIEKVEILKGSAAILFGNVTAGGILNLVTKKPKSVFGGEGGVRVGSFNTYQPYFDVYGPLDSNKNISFRIDGTYLRGESFRKEVESERYYVNPSFQVKFNQKTQLLIEADYLNDHQTPDFGAGIINYEIVGIPRDRFLGVSWGYFDAQQLSTTATLSHKISDDWDLSFVNAIRYYDTDLFTNLRPNSAGSVVLEDGNWDRSIQRSTVKDNYFLQQLDLKGSFSTGKVSHQLLFGGDNEIYKTGTTAYKTKPYDTINIFDNYNPAVEPEIPLPDPNMLTTASVKRFGVYVQDLASLTRHLKVLVGVRFTYQDTETTVLRYGIESTPELTNPTTTNNYDDALSPRAGLILQPNANHSIFASYANSFQTNSGTDIERNPLKPSVIDQYEFGVKNILFKERLYANLTLYQITNSNLAQMSLVNGNTETSIKELAGKTQSRGVEIDLTTNPVEGLSILAGYSFNETKYLRSNIYIVGSELRYNPKHTANLNAHFTFEDGRLKGLNFGIINSYFGNRYAGRSTRLTTPDDTYKLIPLNAYLQSDATIGFNAKKFVIRAKVSNIFNVENYNIHDDNSLNPIAPTNYSIALNYIF